MLARVATELRSFYFSVIIIIIIVLQLIDKGSGKHVILQRQFPAPFGFGRRLIGYRGRQEYFAVKTKRNITIAMPLSQELPSDECAKSPVCFPSNRGIGTKLAREPS